MHWMQQNIQYIKKPKNKLSVWIDSENDANWVYFVTA